MAELKRFLNVFRKLLTLSTFRKIINQTEKSSHSKIATAKIWRQLSMLTVSWCTIYQVKACLELRHKEHNNYPKPLSRAIWQLLLQNNTINFTQKNDTIVHILSWYIEHRPNILKEPLTMKHLRSTPVSFSEKNISSHVTIERSRITCTKYRKIQLQIDNFQNGKRADKSCRNYFAVNVILQLSKNTVNFTNEKITDAMVAQ